MIDHQNQINSKEIYLENRLEFVKFLDSISKINESTILGVEEKSMTSIVSSSDNTLIQYGILCSIKSTFRGNINIPDIKKLIRVLESINTKDIKLFINSNNIIYESDTLKFKYHLYEDGFLVKPPLNIEKIKSFNYDINFTIPKESLQAVIRGSTFASETNKMYLYSEGGFLKGELTDRARHNTDTLALTLLPVDFCLNPIPVNLDNIKALSLIDDNLNFGVNTNYGVLVIDINTDNIKLKYILTSLTQ